MVVYCIRSEQQKEIQMPHKVIIHPYNPEWPTLFTKSGEVLREVLGDVALRIDHIGSTSVVGLDAKPIIDTQISVASFQSIDAFRAPLESLGFIHRVDNPDLTRRFFREPLTERRNHIHVVRFGSWTEQMHLLFRDYMRTHPEDAACYAEMKYQLAEKYSEDRTGYTDAKAPFIWEVLRKADTWANEIGWLPGPSDA